MTQEQQIIQRFGLTYYALKSSIQSGDLTKENALAMTDLMAALFRDYVQLHIATHQAGVAAYEAEKLIEKVKGK